MVYVPSAAQCSIMNNVNDVMTNILGGARAELLVSEPGSETSELNLVPRLRAGKLWSVRCSLRGPPAAASRDSRPGRRHTAEKRQRERGEASSAGYSRLAAMGTGKDTAAHLRLQVSLLTRLEPATTSSPDETSSLAPACSYINSHPDNKEEQNSLINLPSPCTK